MLWEYSTSLCNGYSLIWSLIAFSEAAMYGICFCVIVLLGTCLCLVVFHVLRWFLRRRLHSSGLCFIVLVLAALCGSSTLLHENYPYSACCTNSCAELASHACQGCIHDGRNSPRKHPSFHGTDDSRTRFSHEAIASPYMAAATEASESCCRCACSGASCSPRTEGHGCCSCSEPALRGNAKGCSGSHTRAPLDEHPTQSMGIWPLCYCSLRTRRACDYLRLRGAWAGTTLCDSTKPVPESPGAAQPKTPPALLQGAVNGSAGAHVTAALFQSIEQRAGAENAAAGVAAASSLETLDGGGGANGTAPLRAELPVQDQTLAADAPSGPTPAEEMTNNGPTQEMPGEYCLRGGGAQVLLTSELRKHRLRRAMERTKYGKAKHVAEWCCVRCASSNWEGAGTCRSCLAYRPLCVPLVPQSNLTWMHWDTWENVQAIISLHNREREAKKRPRPPSPPGDRSTRRPRSPNIKPVHGPPQVPTPITPSPTSSRWPGLQAGNGMQSGWGSGWGTEADVTMQDHVGPLQTQPWVQSQDGEAASSNSVPPHLAKPGAVQQHPPALCDAATQTDEGLMPPPSWGNPKKPASGESGMHFHFYVNRSNQPGP